MWLEVRTLADFDGLVFAEAEGKTIGRLRLPSFIFDRLQTGPKILITGSLAARCDRIVSDYGGGTGVEPTLSPELYQSVLAALQAIKERLAGPVLREVQALVANNQLRPAVELLLVHYYDQYYQKHIENDKFILTVCGDDPKEAAALINGFSQRPGCFETQPISAQ